MIAQLQKKATPFLGAGLLIQVGGTFLREINWGLVAACFALGAALLVVGCMYYAVSKGYRREVGLLGLLSVLGVIVLIYMPDREKDAPAQPPPQELPAQTTEAFKDDQNVQEAIASISAMPFAQKGKIDTDELSLDTEPTDDDFEKATPKKAQGSAPAPKPEPAKAAPEKKPLPPSVKASGAQEKSMKEARQAVLGDAQGEIVPSRLLYERAGKLTFTCHCGKRYKVDTSRAGQMMKCKYCEKHLLVPVPELKT